MAKVTDLSLEAGRALGRSYGLGISQIEPLEAGSVNSNFCVRVADGERLFLRIYEEQSRDGAEQELVLLEQLLASGVPTTKPLQRLDGGMLSAHLGKPLAIFGWVEGEILCQERVTSDVCERVGEALAGVHLAKGCTPGPGRFRVADLGLRLARIEREASPVLARAAQEIRDRLDAYAARRDASVPSGLIHGDLFRDNVLWQAGHIRALIDFESASRGPYVYDLMVTVLAWCYAGAFRPELARSLLGAYHRRRPLGRAEVAALPVEAGIGALRFATTRITDYSMRTAACGTPLRDYRRFLARLEAIEHGALDATFAALRDPG